MFKSSSGLPPAMASGLPPTMASGVPPAPASGVPPATALAEIPWTMQGVYSLVVDSVENDVLQNILLQRK